MSRAQASEWIDALEPLYEILSSAGMTSDDAWERVLIFTKAVFDDIRTREGKKVETTLSTLGTLTKDVENMKTKFGQLERDFKGFKNAK